MINEDIKVYFIQKFILLDIAPAQYLFDEVT